jgi:hypothetical protein
VSRGLRSRDARDTRRARTDSSPQRRRSITPSRDFVLDRGLVRIVGAVVVANEDVGVDVTQADGVVGAGGSGAGVDAGFVAGDAGVEDSGGGLGGSEKRGERYLVIVLVGREWGDVLLSVAAVLG